MSESLLQTKLYAPRLRPSLIPRPHLIDQLNQGLGQGAKLSLISAPAGFGKTTLVSEWMAATERPFAWLSLDARDSDVGRFLTYFISALQTIATGETAVGTKALGMLGEAGTAVEMVLTTLLNDLAALPIELALVLDDYHVVDAPAVDEALTFLLEHLPPQLHLVMTTREDPLLPLPRLRARGLLTELRTADLRFSLVETAEFLNQLMGLDLSAGQVAALEQRTEGWIAGLQLAALSMRGRADVAGFIKAFAGDDRYIVDYLVEEVLQGQPEPVRRFLLQTSILDRLSGPLCDAVCFSDGVAVGDGEALLETLERSNLFVIPLDDKRQWYRYHHLFGSVLQARLMKERPGELADLHRRASQWYGDNDFTAEAIRHALAAPDYERAAALIELAWPEMDQSRQSAAWLRWVRALPETLLDNRPVLNHDYAWTMLATGQLEGAETRLRLAELGLERPLDEIVVVDEERLVSLPESIASARAYLAQSRGDVDGTIQYARQALEFIPAEDVVRRGRPAAILSLALWAKGDLETAARTMSEASAHARRAGNVVFAITATYVLTEMLRGLGRIREAIDLCQENLGLAEEAGQPRGTADIHVALTELLMERGELDGARQQLAIIETLGDQAASPYCGYRLRLAQAGLKGAEGEFEEALRLLDEAEGRYVPGPAPEVRSPAAMKARILLRAGRLAESWRWVAEQGLAVDDDLQHLREFEHLTLVRLLIGRFKQDGNEADLRGALSLLERLLETAEAAGRRGSVLDGLIQQTMAFEAAGDIPAALLSLERALALAEPEGWKRLFIGTGKAMAGLLGRLPVRSDFVAELLAAFFGEDGGGTAVAEQGLVEPLSERELEVLRLVAAGLSNRQIAEKLFLALPTVKGHNRVIYGKLNVGRRTEAVARARELGLLS